MLDTYRRGQNPPAATAVLLFGDVNSSWTLTQPGDGRHTSALKWRAAPRSSSPG